MIACSACFKKDPSLRLGSDVMSDSVPCQRCMLMPYKGRVVEGPAVISCPYIPDIFLKKPNGVAHGHSEWDPQGMGESF